MKDNKKDNITNNKILMDEIIIVQHMYEIFLDINFFFDIYFFYTENDRTSPATFEKLYRRYKSRRTRRRRENKDEKKKKKK